MGEEILNGGVANAGAVVRRGRYVLRPSSDHSRSVIAFLGALRMAGFDGASEPVGIDGDGRERLVFIPGDVPLLPYPEWSQSNEALASTAVLLRAMHDAAAAFDPGGFTWSSEMADPAGGSLVCHNDVCLENVVFWNGIAVGLIDFDFAAPGRAIYDVAAFARMCVPIDDPTCDQRFGWLPADRPARLRLVADSYGLSAVERPAMLELLDDAIARGGEFMRRRVEAGDPNFTALWHANGGSARFDLRRAWWSADRAEFADALV